jgi:peptidyl-prolyl cis-trans isomerase B (cyclophilin B)
MKRLLLMATLLSPLWLLGACTDPRQEPDTSKDKNVVVIIDTSMGKIKAELFAEKAPISVNNFLQYVDEKFYDGTIFHRVIPAFMIQGGGYEAEGVNEKPAHRPIKNEAYNRLSNKRGTLAMARTDKADSATSQFFINVEDNSKLDRVNDPQRVGYAVFGRVLEGMDVADEIKFAKRDGNDKPVKDVIIKSIRRVEP